MEEEKNVNSILDIFNKSCIKIAEDESHKQKEEFEKEMHESIEEEKHEYEMYQDKKYKNILSSLEREWNKSRFIIEKNAKLKIQEKNKELKNRLKNRLIEEIENIRNSEKYKNFLWSSITEILTFINNQTINNISINDSNSLIIEIIEKDNEIYGQQLIESFSNVEFKVIDNKFLGGCMYHSKNYNIDNTLLNKLDEILKNYNTGDECFG